MRLLLDTHILLWARSGSPKLSRDARRVIRDADELWVSAASIWEMTVKSALGKLRIDWDEFLSGLREMQISELSIEWKHGLILRELPPHTRDPFDRMLVAQALGETLTLITHDHALAAYGRMIRLV